MALAAEVVITPILQHRINRLSWRRIRTLRRAGRNVVEGSAEDGDGHVVASLHEIRRSYRLRMRMNRLKALLKVTRNLIDNVAELGVLVIGAWMVMQGRTEIGVVVAFLTGLRTMRGPWSELVNFYRRLSDARVKYRLVYGVIRPEGPSPPQVPPPGREQRPPAPRP